MVRKVGENMSDMIIKSYFNQSIFRAQNEIEVGHFLDDFHLIFTNYSPPPEV